MLAEYQHSLRRLSGPFLAWAIGVAAYGVMMAFFYPYFTDMGEVIENFLAMMPAGLNAVFENLNISGTPLGYIDVYYFSYMHLILGIYVIGTGSGMLARDEESGVLDLVLAYPISRTALFIGRWLAFLTALVGILAAGYLSWVWPALHVGIPLSGYQLLQPFLSLFALLMVFFAAALLLSLIAPSAKVAAMIAGALLAGNFLLRVMSNINTDLKSLLKLTPLGYYQAGQAIESLNVAWLAGLLAAALLLSGLAVLIFHCRDIRVSGEHGGLLRRMLTRHR